jgi:potassium-dependent mechanosensitive channel
MIKSATQALSILSHTKTGSIQNRLFRFALCAVVIVFGSCLPAAGQKDTGTTLKEISADTTLTRPKKLRKVMEELGERARGNNIQRYKESRNALRQADIIGQIKRITLQASDFVKSGIDTATIWNELHDIDSLFDLAGDGIFTNTGTIQTNRNLTISYRIISVLLSKSSQRKEELDEYRKLLAGYKFRLDSLSADSVLYEFPADSATFAEYLNTLFTAAAEIAPADSAIQKSSENVQGLQLQLTLQVNKLSRALEKINASHAALSANTFKREFVNTGPSASDTRPLAEIMKFSKRKNLLALNYYVENNLGKIVFSLLVIIALSIFLRILKRRLSKENELRPDFAGQIVFRYPIYSAGFLGLNLLQFLFQDTPFIFSMIFWVLSAFCLTIIFREYITRFWNRFWLTISMLFLLACFNNLILQASRQESWWMLVLAAAGLSVGIYFLITGKRNQLKENGVVYFISFMVLLEFFSVLFNVSGRYNLSKTLLTSGYINVIIGIELLWTARLLQGMLLVAARFYGRSEKILSDVNSEKAEYKVPVTFYLLLFVGWFILFGRNFYSFRWLITDPLARVLVTEHTIGNYSFTVNNLLVFIVIFVVSTLLSNIVSFFTSHTPGTVPDKNSPKSKMGSWILLIRITIICGGLFLASAAAGIPLDRITIVLGALGVGIGFGLQDLTSSLVSGIIIAFEKPVNVGDIVEVAEQSGTMKSIGFRSSVITNMDGADVIIPNNTLLSSNLINWTMSDEKRRVEVELQVLYGADLNKLKKILLELLDSDEHILKHPAPSVEFSELKYSIVDLHIFFWLIQVPEWENFRSDVIQEIDRVFRENDIAMPLPPS